MKNFSSLLSAGLIIVVTCLFLPSCKKGPSGNPEDKAGQRLFTVSELQADFRQLRKFLEKSHPQLYRFTSQREFDSLFETHYRMINKPMTTQEFYSIIVPLVARVGCGHTALWSPDGYWDTAPERMFPLSVYAREGQLFVIHGYHQPSPVGFGCRILSVNGLDAGDMVGEMLGNISSDGFIMTKRYRRLNSVFPYLYALNYGFPEEFEIMVSEKGKAKRLRLEPIPRSVVVAYHDSLVATGVIKKEDLNLELVDGGTALMTIRTFAYYDDNKGFNNFIDSSFQVIYDHRTGNLVLDLRGNDGGDPFCSSHLLSYLENKPMIYFQRPYGTYARLNQPLPMAETPFTGKQYYLIDGMCFSTTGHLASLLKYYRLGTFIGEETGGTYTCNDASHDTYLKHTGYRLQSARFSFATAVIGLPQDHGIMPDYPVEAPIDELIRGDDTVLAFALELIQQDRSK